MKDSTLLKLIIETTQPNSGWLFFRQFNLTIPAELQNGARTEDISAARAQVRDLELQLSLAP